MNDSGMVARVLKPTLLCPRQVTSRKARASTLEARRFGRQVNKPRHLVNASSHARLKLAFEEARRRIFCVSVVPSPMPSYKLVVL